MGKKASTIRVRSRKAAAHQAGAEKMLCSALLVSHIHKSNLRTHGILRSTAPGSAAQIAHGQAFTQLIASHM